MSKPVKIVFYINSLAKGGAQRVILNLTESFMADGIMVTLVTTGQYEDEYALPKGVKRVFSDIQGEEIKESRIRNFFGRLTKLRRIWKTENPDVILSLIGKNNIMAVLSSFLIGIPVLVSVRGEPTAEYNTRLLRLLSKTLFFFAAGIIVQTKDAQAYFPKAMQKKTVILPNPLHPAFVKPRYEGERTDEIVSVGRVDENKNHKMLIDAFLMIADQNPKTVLRIYGQGSSRDMLIDYVAKKHMEERIFLPGNATQIADKIKKARIFVLTSDTEGMPNALMEAMALGLACVSTDCPCGGPKTLIQEGINGMLVPVRDTAYLSQVLAMILKDKELEEKLGRQAHEIIKRCAPKRVSEEWRAYMERFGRKD